MTSDSQSILIIDDQPTNVFVLSEALGAEHEILFSLSGREALDIAETQMPDLILLDIMMPEMDGYEICHRLKANPKTRDIPVIFVTARDQDEDETQGLEAGAIDYLTKPVQPAIIRARVRNHLAFKRAREELAEYRDHLEGLVEERTSEIRALQELLIQKEKLAILGQLTATVSHEIRNPLGIISTSLYLIGQRTRGKDLGLEKAMDRAFRNIKRCDRIIEELLDSTRKMDLVLISTEVDPWLEKILDEQEIPENIRQAHHLASGTTLDLDRDRIERCVINVINNACQAMGEEENRNATDDRLTIESRRTGNRLEILVTDTGMGIEPEAMEKIFEPLFSSKSFGVGLGLSNTRQIMEQHGGGIEMESQPGKGTTVILWMPLD